MAEQEPEVLSEPFQDFQIHHNQTISLLRSDDRRVHFQPIQLDPQPPLFYHAKAGWAFRIQTTRYGETQNEFIKISNILRSIKDHYPIDAQQWVTDFRRHLDFSPSLPKYEVLTLAHLLPTNDLVQTPPQFIQHIKIESETEYQTVPLTRKSILRPEDIIFLPIPVSFITDVGALSPDQQTRVPVIVWPCHPHQRVEVRTLVLPINHQAPITELVAAHAVGIRYTDPKPGEPHSLSLPPSRKLINRCAETERFWASIGAELAFPLYSEGKTVVRAVVGAMGSGKSSFITQSHLCYFDLAYSKPGEGEVYHQDTVEQPRVLFDNTVISLAQLLSKRRYKITTHTLEEAARVLLAATLYGMVAGRLCTFKQAGPLISIADHTFPSIIALRLAHQHGKTPDKCLEMAPRLRMRTNVDVFLAEHAIQVPDVIRTCHMWQHIEGILHIDTDTEDPRDTVKRVLERVNDVLDTISVPHRHFLPLHVVVDEVCEENGRDEAQLMSALHVLSQNGYASVTVAGRSDSQISSTIQYTTLITSRFRLSAINSRAHLRELLQTDHGVSERFGHLKKQRCVRALQQSGKFSEIEKAIIKLKAEEDAFLASAIPVLMRYGGNPRLLALAIRMYIRDGIWTNPALIVQGTTTLRETRLDTTLFPTMSLCSLPLSPDWHETINVGGQDIKVNELEFKHHIMCQPVFPRQPVRSRFFSVTNLVRIATPFDSEPNDLETAAMRCLDLCEKHANGEHVSDDHEQSIEDLYSQCLLNRLQLWVELFPGKPMSPTRLLLPPVQPCQAGIATTSDMFWEQLLGCSINLEGLHIQRCLQRLTTRVYGAEAIVRGVTEFQEVALIEKEQLLLGCVIENMKNAPCAEIALRLPVIIPNGIFEKRAGEIIIAIDVKAGNLSVKEFARQFLRLAAVSVDVRPTVVLSVRMRKLMPAEIALIDQYQTQRVNLVRDEAKRMGLEDVVDDIIGIPHVVMGVDAFGSGVESMFDARHLKQHK